MQSKLIGKIVDITDKESIYYNEWGIIIKYDGEHYHIAIACETLETAKQYGSVIFRKKEFKVRRR